MEKAGLNNNWWWLNERS